MRRPHAISTTCLLFLCLSATSHRSASAEDSRWSDDGLSARIGSSVGYSDLAHSRWSTLGGHVAVGYRLGTLALEGEYERSKLLFYTGLSNRDSGEHKRFGANLRWYFADLASGQGKRTRILLFGEGSMGWQRGQLKEIDFARRDIGVGFGWLLNHKVKDSEQRLDSIGWHVGWRITSSSRPAEATARIVCGKHCPMEDPLPDSVDMGLTMGSSLSLRWH